MAAAVAIGSLKMRSHSLKTRLLVIITELPLVALSDEREQHLGFFGALLDVPDVVQDQQAAAYTLPA
jgi:hypothetical protein